MHDPACLFCRIASGAIPAKRVYEDEEILAFEDIRPQAPVHLLIIPKTHIPTVADITQPEQALVGRLVGVANRLAAEKKLDQGFRVVINCRQDGGQEVYHLHLHLLGGRRFTWPPG